MIGNSAATEKRGLARRQESTRGFKARPLPPWSFREILAPSTLRDARFTQAQVSDIAETRHRRSRPRIDINDPRANAPGSPAHSVVGRGVLHLRCIKAFGTPLDYGLLPHHAAARATPCRS